MSRKTIIEYKDEVFQERNLRFENHKKEVLTGLLNDYEKVEYDYDELINVLKAFIADLNELKKCNLSGLNELFKDADSIIFDSIQSFNEIYKFPYHPLRRIDIPEIKDICKKHLSSKYHMLGISFFKLNDPSQDNFEQVCKF